MTNHVQIADSLAAEEFTARTAKTVCNVARQGDLMLVREDDAQQFRPEPCPQGGWLLAAGAHGEHRAIARGSARCQGGELLVAEGAEVVVVHTDVPSARHGALRLGAGRWTYRRLRELGLADALEAEVAD